MRVAGLSPELACDFLIAEARLCESYEPGGGNPDGAEKITTMEAGAWLASGPKVAN
jgi:hypothetical protein